MSRLAMSDLKYSLNLVKGPRARIPGPQKGTGLMDTVGNGREAMRWYENLPRNTFRRRVGRTKSREKSMSRTRDLKDQDRWVGPGRGS